MVSKKYTLLAALMLGAASGGWAQLGGVHNYMDSSYIPASRMAQQNEWKNNTSNQNFPARPRDMWQLGVTGGLFMVNGDCPSLPGWNAGLSLRKALGYVVSVRASINYGQTKGLDYRKNGYLGNNPALSVYGATGGPGFYVANFKNTTINPSVEFLFSFNNIMFHSKQSKLNVYGLVGYSPFFYQTQLDALKGNAAYNYAGLSAGFFSRSRKDIRNDLKNFFDGTYETDALVAGGKRAQSISNNRFGNYMFVHAFSLGMGMEYRLAKQLSLSWEAKVVSTPNDYLDGAAMGVNKDNLIYTNLGLNFNLGNPAKRTAPLWWLNPLEYAYGEMNNPTHSKLPKQVLPDGDEDGVTDQFDVEPNTPAGCPVDAKGKSRDTDGDGVPDCRDKELITPTSCQPVNADGVGKCPDPECCKNRIVETPGSEKCTIGNLPSVNFKGGSVSVSKEAAAILASAASQIKNHPACKICVVGHGAASKKDQQLSWDRANAVKMYLVEKLGISEDRFGFKYGEDGDSSTVDLMDCTGDESPNSVPAPHPNLQKTK